MGDFELLHACIPQVGFDVSASLNISDASWESPDDAWSFYTANGADRGRAPDAERESASEKEFRSAESERSHPKSFFVIGSREGEGLF